MTETEQETGYKKGFTSFAGITYDSEKDVTENRISNVEGVVNETNKKISANESEITDIQMALVEIFEMVVGGDE